LTFDRFAFLPAGKSLILTLFAFFFGDFILGVSEQESLPCGSRPSQMRSKPKTDSAPLQFDPFIG
jgi:hypothetical protein